MSGRRWARRGPGQAASPEAVSHVGGPPPVSVVWHKWSDLRLTDHEPVVRAHARQGQVLHVHLVELPLLAGKSRVGGVPRCGSCRAAFWREAVSDLSRRLEERGQRLLVRAVESPAEFFAVLCSRLRVGSVFAHREFCDEELRTEAAVRRVLEARGAKLETLWGALTVHHIDDLGFDPADPQQMPAFKGEFNGIAKKRPVRQVLPIPSLRPPPALDDSEHGPGALAAAFAAGPPVSPPEERQAFKWTAGETAALEYLSWYMDSGQLRNYRGATESFAHGDHNPVNAGTRLSPWLAFGCLSARMVVHASRDFERTHGKSSSTGKGNGKMGSTGARLHTELNFRDFLRFSALSWGTDLFKIGGPFKISGVAWGHDHELFAKWRAGQTGYPFVDAGMRELAATGYMSHLHRQCCAAFLVRDLRLDWRMGAEHFESCLLDHTPDANWGNWAYRILQRPGLVESRRDYPVEEHITTMECVAWPAVHDAELEHTLRWVPELAALPRDLAREPWRTETVGEKRISVKPYRDSPLWFCAANRANWDYEYFWLPGHAWTVKRRKVAPQGDGFCLGRDYPAPLVPPLNIELDLDALPVKHSWGDTAEGDRPHIWGSPGATGATGGDGAGAGARTFAGKGKGKGKGKGRGDRAVQLRDSAYEAGRRRQRADKGHRVASEFYSTRLQGA